MWFGFQFNLSDSSDDDLYRLEFDPKGQGHQWKMISIQLGSYFGAPKKKLSRGCLRVRPDANANADANRSKTICRPPLKGVDIIFYSHWRTGKWAGPAHTNADSLFFTLN